jgi:DNA modification methylase
MEMNENIKLLHGDCIELFPKIPDASIDAIITDPPYGITKCDWDKVVPFDSLWKHYNRVLKRNGVIVIFGTEPFTSELVCSNKKMFREKLTWQKHRPSNMGNAKRMHLKYSEDIIVFSFGRNIYNPQMQPRTSNRVRQAQKGTSKQWRTNGNTSREVCFATQYAPRSWDSFNADWKYPSNILPFPAVVSNSREKVNHPTQKPVSLLMYLIKTYTQEDALILDTFMGSGTTGVACINTGRKFIGMELDDNYFSIAKTRIENAIREKERSLFSERGAAANA